MFIEYNIWFDISGIVILLVITLLYLLKNSLENTPNLLFKIMLGCCFLSTITDLWYGVWMNSTINIMWANPQLTNEIINYVYYLGHLGCAFVFFRYTIAVLGIQEKRRVTLITSLPYAIANLEILLNPFFPFVFTIDENGFYARQSGVFFIYACAGYYLLCGFVVLLRYGSRMFIGKTYSLLTFVIMSGGGIFIQGVAPYMLVENYCTDLCLLFVYLSMSRPEDITDEFTGLLNSQAFTTLATSYLGSRKTFTILFVYLTDSAYIHDILGDTLLREVRSSISDYFSKTFRRAYIFHLDSGQYCLLYRKRSDMRKENALSAIVKRFGQSWKVADEPTKFTPHIVVINCPEHAKTLQEIQDIIAATVHAKEERTVLSLESLDTASERRYKEIDKISRTCVQDQALEVMYQPVWDVHNQTYPFAEALVRLTDRKLGRISPEELVTVAEHNGTIQKIDNYVLEHVCSFINHYQPAAQSINVNLSMVECVQNNLVKRLTSTTTRWQINPEKLHFEITETVSNRFPDIAKRNIFSLIDQGFLFCLDDFGQGYSNLDRLIGLPFSVIKFDRQFILGDERVQLLMASLMGMLGKMGKSVLVEGVETKEQADIAIARGADFIQGYYFAKPLTQTEYLEFLKIHKN